MNAPPLLSVVLVATGPDRIAVRMAEWLANQRDDDVEYVLVHDRADEGSARRSLGRAAARIATFVQAGDATPGRARNAAVRATTGRWFVVYDGGETLAPGYLPAVRIAAGHPDARFAISTPPGSASGPSITAETLVAGPWALGDTPAIRRDAFEAAGGFDETLPALVEWDLLLTLEGGLRLPDGLSSRPPDDDLRRRERLRAERYLPAVRRVVEKHSRIFVRHMAAAVVGRDRCGLPIWHQGHEIGARYERARADLAAVLSRLAVVRAELQAAGAAADDWSRLRRTSPVSRHWGSERGRPIDRYYIEAFIARHAGDVQGRVLEMLDGDMATTFGGPRVEALDVVDIDPGNHRATIVGDLREAERFPASAYDCFILTQTLHLLDDMTEALRTAWRVLKPGGVLLATLPCASMVAVEYGATGDHWRVTDAGARRLFEAVFPPECVDTETHGNVLAITAFLHGLSCDDVTPAELDSHDPAYPLVVTVRAVKPQAPGMPTLLSGRSPRSAILIYHRIARLDRDEHRLAVAPEDFRSQLEELRRHWRPTSLRELASAVSEGDPPDRAVALTFDDGYVDNLEHALPLLAEFGIPATFFLTSESPDLNREYWWDVLQRILLHSPALPSTVALRLDGRVSDYGTATPGERQTLHRILYARCRIWGPAVRDDLIRQLLALAPGGGSVANARPMRTEEIAALAAHPLATVGAHGVHHRAASALHGEDLHREVFECRTTLERLTGGTVDLFAYPFGDLSDAAVTMVRAAGYRAAVSCDPRTVRRLQPLHRLPRVEPPEGGGPLMHDWLTRVTLGAPT